ncbi:phosphatidylserine/phosphatidylglycerophosphate/cardiolipin synthase family protein [Lysobacter sp. TAF61]|uniref:phospholipase D-like domain-containing protein n=1 Tax=Lysobacter sp. TAF61 TaxID=3233072 RepID=UPI003F9B1A73
MSELLDRWFIAKARRGQPPAACENNDVTAYIHYVDYYRALGDALRTAGEGNVVLLAGWSIDLDTPLGDDPKQTVGELLKQAGAARARVCVLLSGHHGNPSPPAADWLRRQPGCAAILDDRTRLPGCFHQKAAAVLTPDGVTAFVGGMDIGRDRLADPVSKRAPWHDVQVKLRGPAAHDVYATLAARWGSHASQRSTPIPGTPRAVVNARAGTARAVQVVRTYGNPCTGIPLTVLRPENARASMAQVMRDVENGSEFSFAPKGESSIHDLLVQAIRATRESIYVEEQYFVASAAMGGQEELLQALAEAIARPSFKHMLVLTTGVGTVQGELFQTNQRRRDLVRRIAARFPDKISLWAYKGGQDRCYWLHSKMWIFDDTMAVIGSANFNRRGLSHDGELGVGVVDTQAPARGWVRELRKRLWLKHLPTAARPVTAEQVDDFEQGRALWVDTGNTLLFRMDTEAGEPSQPDRLMVCSDPPPPTRWGRFVRGCACAPYPFGGPLRSYQRQWDLALDPDGT